MLPPRSSASPARETLTEDGLPHCDHCNDLRSIRADVPVGHPDFGRLIPCPACGELALRQRRQQIYRSRRKRIQRYTQRAGRALRQTFENFDPRKAEGSCAVMIRKAQAAAQKFAQAPRGWLILYGTKGTGKSHLAAAIANHLETLPEAASPLVMFLTCPDLLDLLRSGYSVGDYEDLLYLCRTVDVLIVDDLGVERENDWTTEKLFQILNHRYQAELATVIVTNCRLEMLEPRIYDRLSDDDLCTRVEMLAPSYRQRQSAPNTFVQ